MDFSVVLGDVEMGGKYKHMVIGAGGKQEFYTWDELLEKRGYPAGSYNTDGKPSTKVITPDDVIMPGDRSVSSSPVESNGNGSSAFAHPVLQIALQEALERELLRDARQANQELMDELLKQDGGEKEYRPIEDDIFPGSECYE